MLSLLRFLLYFLLLLLPTAIMAQQKVTLNFTDMDINLLINTISEVTKKTFIVDPRVKAKVTVVSNSPLDPDQVYEVFLSILSVHGFAAVPSGAVIKIIPENLAKAEDTPVLSSQELPKGETLITQVIQVKHVSAPQLIPLLRPLVHQEGHLVAYPNNNTLIISDHANTVNRVMEIIRRLDQPDSKDIEIIVLEHASATEVVRTLTTLEQQNAAAAAASGTTNPAHLVADERTNSILISGDRDTRLQIRALIAHLDTPVKNVGNTQVIYLRYAQASDLVNVLKGVSDTIAQTLQTEGQKPVAKDTVKTNIQADKSTNSLVITATPEVLQNLQTVIRQLDIRRAQVLVEAIIAEITTDKARELGVQWLFYGSKGTNPIGFSNFDNTGNKIVDLASAAYQLNKSTNATLPKLDTGALLGLGRFSSTLNFATLLQALSTDVSTNVLSTPSLLTLDNEEAEIVVGQNVPFVTGQYTTTGANNGAANPFQTIQRQDVGLKLKVKPQINEGNTVKLQIEQEVSSITPSSIATADIVTNKRTIKTTVIVEDGNLVVLGGLIDEDLQQTTQKVPVLGDIPILGSLFRSDSTKKVKRNLMVFLHPVIVRDATMETAISGGKYNQMRNRQLEQKAQDLPLMSKEEIPVLPNLKDFIIILPGEAVSLPPKIKAQPLK